MDTRALNLGTPQIEMLQRIAAAGSLLLDELQLDDVMALGGLRLIELAAGKVSLTPRGARFLAFAIEHPYSYHISAPPNAAAPPAV